MTKMELMLTLHVGFGHNVKEVVDVASLSDASPLESPKKYVPSSSSHDDPLRKSCCWKPCKEKKRMVVGQDVGLGKLPHLLGRTLVGRFCGKNVSTSSLREWIDKNWFESLGYCPIFHLLARGWICYIFKSSEDMQVILSKSWAWGPSRFVCKEWSITFDLLRDSLSPSKLWVILPNLPIIFWLEDILKEIANTIGSFVGLEHGWEHKVDRCWAWVHVEMDMHGGLPDEIDIVWNNMVVVQHLDYWRILFRCYDCHAVGHIHAHCPRASFFGHSKSKKWVRKGTSSSDYQDNTKADGQVDENSVQAKAGADTIVQVEEMVYIKDGKIHALHSPNNNLVNVFGHSTGKVDDVYVSLPPPQPSPSPDTFRPPPSSGDIGVSVSPASISLKPLLPPKIPSTHLPPSLCPSPSSPVSSGSLLEIKSDYLFCSKARLNHPIPEGGGLAQDVEMWCQAGQKSNISLEKSQVIKEIRCRK
jgi:hypothetical protein